MAARSTYGITRATTLRRILMLKRRAGTLYSDALPVETAFKIFSSIPFDLTA